MHAEYTAASATVVRGLTFVAEKSFKMPERWVPLLSLLLGIGTGIALYYVPHADEGAQEHRELFVRSVIEGILAGLAALGFTAGRQALAAPGNGG